MNLRNIILLTGLAAFLTGCVTNPRPVPPRDYDQRYDVNYYDYRGTPSYEGYYYARIIFINNVPYYVDDDRYIRPIPPRLHDHFRRYPYDTLGRPPVFSRDAEVRDGYPVSRIIYLDGVPYHVENNRIAQPLPKQLRQHFRYTPANPGNAPANGNHPQPPAQPPAQHDNARNNEPPVHVRDQDREQMKQPPLERGQREGENKAPADSKGTTTPSPDRRISPWLQDQQNTAESHAGTTKPSPDRRISPWLQDQPNAGESHAATPSGKERDLNGNRPQSIVDTDKMNADKMNADKMNADKMKADKKNVDKKKSPPGKKDKPDDSGNKKDKQGDSTKADDDSGNKKDNEKKPRKGKDDNQ